MPSLAAAKTFAAGLQTLGRSAVGEHGAIAAPTDEPQRETRANFAKSHTSMTLSAGAQVGSPAPTLGTVSDPKVRVLVIDPSADRRGRLRDRLAQEGYEVEELERGDGASIAMHATKPDLVVMCGELLDKPAHVICRELKETELGKLTPVVLIGDAAVADDRIAQGLLAGADDYLTGDRGPLELRARLRVQLRSRRDREILTGVQVERDALRREASLDPLTGVLNRRSFEATLYGQLALREPFALFFLDIDHFKSVNDTFGHDVGDVVLQAVAERLRRAVRGNDVCARLGGEEFVILARTVTTDLAVKVAERHRLGIEALLFPQLAGRRITISLGVAVFDPAQPDASPEALLQRADHAVYEAKRSGRNRVVLAPPVPPPDADEARDVPSIAPWTDEPKTLQRSIVQAVSSKPPISSPGSRSESVSPLETHLQQQLANHRMAIPVLPDVATEALRMANDPNLGAMDLAKVVDRSPQVGGRFISLANSAFYGRGAKLASTQAAIARLGLGGTRDLILQIVCEQSTTGLPRYQQAVSRSMQRSVLAAVTARTVCWELKHRSDNAYLYGLLHDIGESRVYRILADVPPVADGLAEVEDLVQRYHARAGADVITAWNLPADIAEACAMHHETSENPSMPIRVTMISDVLVDIVQAPPANGVSSRHLERLAKLGIAEGRALALIQATREVAKAI